MKENKDEEQKQQVSEIERKETKSAIDSAFEQFLKQQNEFINQKSDKIIDDIEKLSNILEEITGKQREDFLHVFNSFMRTVKNELKNKLDRIIKTYNMKLNLDTNIKLKSEIGTFRDHAIRLNNFCTTLKERINELTSKMNLMTLEMTSITMKWKNSEAINQKLISEFEKELRHHKQIEDDLALAKEELKRETEEKLYCQNLNQQEEDKKDNYLAVIDKLRNELKKEKSRNQRMECELNKMRLERNKLESIFIDCIEETRKSILTRRIRENLKNQKSTKMNLFKTQSRIFDVNNPLFANYDINTKYDTFSASDKQQILEKFLFNEEVSRVLRNCLFVNPEKEKKLIETKNQLIKRIGGSTELEQYSTDYLSSPGDQKEEVNLFLTKNNPFVKKGINFNFPRINNMNKRMHKSFSSFKY